MNDRSRVKILADIFFWCLENNIEVRLFKRYEWPGDDGAPILRFSRNSGHIELSLWRLTDDTNEDYLKSELAKVGLQLCVSPFEVSK